MLKITWRRTVIGGKRHPEDFIAEDENGRTIGRIYRHHSGGWFYAFPGTRAGYQLADELSHFRRRGRQTGGS